MNTIFSRVRGHVVAALFLTAASASTVRADSAELGTAKELYAQASYEDALVQLNSITDADVANQVDQYRALCLLALGREAEAGKSLERMVVRAPLYVVRSDDAPPKLVALFQQVRARTLPSAAKDLYAKARESFDGKRFTQANAQFEEMLAVLKEAGDDPKSPVADLKQLGEGFLRLTKAELTPAVPAAPTAAAARALSTTPRTYYTLENADIVAPVDIFRELPPWVPPAALANMTLGGKLQLDIDEHGLVERATLLEPITPLYDSRLLAAAKSWKFQPATKDGAPVKFRKTISLVLHPADK